MTLHVAIHHTFGLLQCLDAIVSGNFATGNAFILTNMAVNLRFPSIRFDFQNEISAFRPAKTPDLYLIDLGRMDIEEVYVYLENRFMFNPLGLHVILAEKSKFELLRKKISKFFVGRSVLIDVKFSLETECGFVKYQRSYDVLKIYYTYQVPYTTCHTCEKKGYLLDVLDMILRKSKIRRKYKKIVMPQEDQILDLLHRRKQDVFLGPFPYTTYGWPQKHDLTKAFSRVSVDVFVPKTQPVPRWKYLINIFSLEVWSLFLISMLAMFILTIVSVHMFEKGQADVVLYLLAIYKIVIGQTVHFSFRYYYQKITFGSLVYYAYFFLLFYNSKFAYFLTGQNFERPIKSLEDAISAGLLIGTSAGALGYIKLDAKFAKALDGRSVICDFGLSCVDRCARKRDLAVILPKKKALSSRDLFIDENGDDMIELAQSEFFGYMICVFFVKGHPVLPVVDVQIQRVFEAGIVDYVSLSYDRWRIYKKKKIENDKLTLVHLVPPIFVLIFGYACSFLCFCVEKFYVKHQQKPKN